MKESKDFPTENTNRNEAFDRLAALINEGERMMKQPDFFKPASECFREESQCFQCLEYGETNAPKGELRIMRRWNSHAPSLFSIQGGGGYFLRWRGKGTVIDPGYSFIKRLQDMTNYHFGDIDMVIVTHDHEDHCYDLGALFALFREYNKRFANDDDKKHWDVLVSDGVADAYSSFLDGAKNIELHVPTTASNKTESEYHFKLSTLPAQHQELFGSKTTFGVRFDLGYDNDNRTKEDICKTVVISSDTAFSDDNIKSYENADLLILHVGAIGEYSEPRGMHLCFRGVVDILSQLEHPPKLVVLTEWGYEFGRLGVNGRTEFTRLVAQELSDKYYAAVANDDFSPSSFPEGKIPIIPADLDLRIELPTLKVICYEGKNGCTAYDCRNVVAVEDREKIIYHKQ